MKKYFIVTSALLALSGCVDPQQDKIANRQCQGMGLNQGTPEYASCVSEQRDKRLMEEQRKEYEQMKQYDQDWKLRRY